MPKQQDVVVLPIERGGRATRREVSAWLADHSFLHPTVIAIIPTKLTHSTFTTHKDPLQRLLVDNVLE
jgi:hypothetical protein